MISTTTTCSCKVVVILNLNTYVLVKHEKSCKPQTIVGECYQMLYLNGIRPVLLRDYKVNGLIWNIKELAWVRGREHLFWTNIRYLWIQNWIIIKFIKETVNKSLFMTVNNIICYIRKILLNRNRRSRITLLRFPLRGLAKQQSGVVRYKCKVSS